MAGIAKRVGICRRVRIAIMAGIARTACLPAIVLSRRARITRLAIIVRMSSIAFACWRACLLPGLLACLLACSLACGLASWLAR